MSNFKADILEAVNVEPIEAIVVGAFTGTYWPHLEDKGSVPAEKLNQIVSWDEAAPWLDYEYSDGLGIPDCHAVYVWTPTRVFYIREYDGSTELRSVPRHPIPVKASY